MSVKEYFYIVFHPKKAFAKLRAYISILESALGVAPTYKEVLFEVPSRGLVVLGDDTIIKDSMFAGDSLLVVHPDAKQVVVMYCTFVDDYTRGET